MTINSKKDVTSPEIAARLRSARDQLGLTQAELAAASNLQPRQLQRMERGEQKPSLEVLTALTLRGINLHWLLSGNGPITSKSGELVLKDGSQLGDGYVFVPKYDISASAGPGMFAGEANVVDHLAFREEWVRRSLGVQPSDLALITAVGDSMEPAIRAGDLLLVHTGIDRFRDDAIYVVTVEDRLLVKRVQCLLNGAVVVRSDNPSYIEQMLGTGELDQVRVAGRVVWIARMV